jgi:MoxR-like ATPase
MTTSPPPTASADLTRTAFKGAPFDASVPGPLARVHYVYHDPRIEHAVNIALVTRRPLLVTGTPGSGKSTLADDVAWRLGWALTGTTITSRTRLDDLVARFDSVQRLSDAAVGQVDQSKGAYIVPGVLWWAFAPEKARQLPAAEDRRENPSGSERGTVVLLDEIDKAEPDLPNDLLAPLDRYVIDVPMFGEISAEKACLVIITSNGERTMPPAFLRRCVTLELDNSDPRFFVAVAESHFGKRPGDDTLYSDVADRTLGLVAEASRARRRVPSMAEYLDTLRACVEFGERPGSPLWERIEEAALRKTRSKPPTAGDSP